MSVFNTFCWKYLLREMGGRTKFLPLFDVWLGGFALSFLTPIALLGGEAAMVFGINKKFNISWQKGTASIIIFRMLNLSVILLFLLTGIFCFLSSTGLISGNILLTSILATVGLALVLTVFYYRCFKKKSFLKPIFKIFGKKYISKNQNAQDMLEIENEVFSFLKPKNKAVLKLFLGLLLTNAVLNLIRFWFVAYILTGNFLNLLQILAVFAFVHVAYILPIPAALGSLEASQAFVFASLGQGANVGTAFSLIVRGAELFITLMGLVSLARMWFRLESIKLFFQKMSVFKKRAV